MAGTRVVCTPDFQLFTVSEVAQRLRLSERQIRRMIADGRIPVVRLGRAVRIRSEVVAALIEGK
jgi:excisionase family DNA binding protein